MTGPVSFSSGFVMGEMGSISVMDVYGSNYLPAADFIVHYREE
jgi:hypothetical protein